MDAFELFTKDGKSTGVFCCGKCRKITLDPAWTEPGNRKNTQESAEACCRPQLCQDCGAELDRYGHDRCGPCQTAKWDLECRERREKRLAEAIDVTDTYAGWVYCEEKESHNNGFFSDVTELLEYIEDYDSVFDEDGNVASPGPEWVFACQSHIKALDIEWAIECLCDDGYEDMAANLTTPESLKAAVAEFNEVNQAALTVWNPDYTRKVRVNYDQAGNQAPAETAG